MRPSLLQKMDVASRHTMPVLLTLALTLLSQVPTHIPALAGVMPPLALMGVYYWAIYRPDLLPAWLAFVIGLLYDIVAGTPLGVNALVMLLVQGTAASQRKFFLGKSFAVTWWAFSLLTAGAIGMAWMLLSFIKGRPLDIAPVAFEYLMTLALFPLLTWTLARTQLAFLRDV